MLKTVINIDPEYGLVKQKTKKKKLQMGNRKHKICMTKKTNSQVIQNEIYYQT